MKRLQPPLKAPSTRIRLLLWSYEDAAIGSNEGARGSKAQSRGLSRNPELWNHGAYEELERAMNALRRIDNLAFRHVEALHVGRPWHLQPEATEVLDRLASLVPLSQWQVPSEIGAAAGYMPYEAKEWQLRCMNQDCRVCRRASS